MRELMALPVDAITFDDVVDFCSHQTPENMRLEYKQRFSTKDAGKQIAKEVAAFANTQGGTLIFGVEEGSNRRPVKSPTGENLGKNPRQTVITACTHEIFPPVIPDVSDYLPNPNHTSRGFLVVRVSPSEDLHTVDAGTGVYLRANDQSEPLRATMDQINWLIQRRGKGMSLQTARRENAIRQLRDALETKVKDRNVRVAIGPSLAVEPLFDLRELRTRAASLSVPSWYFHASKPRVPIGSDHDARAVADGLYSLDIRVPGKALTAGKIDVFGNVILVTNLFRRQNLDTIFLPDDEAARLVRIDRHPMGFDVAAVVERLLCAVRVANNIRTETGYVGHFELLLRVLNVRGCALVFPTDPHMSLLGSCPLDDQLCVQRTFLASDLSTDPLPLLDDFVHELLCAWGHKVDGNITATVIDKAEQYHYGIERCRCGRHQCPANRKICLDCRTRAV